jgi:hypothetical protein
MVETLVSAAVLGFGVLGLFRLYEASIGGASISRGRAAATELALDQLERLGTMPAESLPGCAGAVGCRASVSEARPALAEAGGFACTRLVNDMGALDAPSADEGRFRVDTVVAAHPGAQQQLGGVVVTISVCWRDDDGALQEVRAQRLLLPEV